MTKVTVNPGNCGNSVTIKAGRINGQIVSIEIETDCEMVQKMLNDITALDMRLLFVNHINNPVYRSAAAHLKHAACPVPCAILKAAEVELGLCLPEDVHIKFIKDK